MKLMHATTDVRKGIEKNLHNYGGSEKIMHVCLLSGGTLKAAFATVESCEARASQFVCQKTHKAFVTTVQGKT